LEADKFAIWRLERWQSVEKAGLQMIDGNLSKLPCDSFMDTPPSCLPDVV
jgi:hypothetical protein